MLARVFLASLGDCVSKAVSNLPPRRTSLNVQTVKAGHPQ
jgi:hypothetical protein